MHKEEIDLLKSYLSNAKFYFEYGCGNSTVLAGSFENIQKIVSVDSCLSWIQRTEPKLKYAEKVSFKYIDINANCDGWGVPADNSKIDNWKTYYSSILEQDEKFDLILVDGIFRVCCCAAASVVMTKNSLLLLHDCHRYSDIPLEKIDQVKSLGVYIKNSLCDNELFEIIEKNKYNCQ